MAPVPNRVPLRDVPLSLGAPVSPTPYLQGSAPTGRRGWRGEGPARPQTLAWGPGPGPRPGRAADGGRGAGTRLGRGRRRVHTPPPCPRARPGASARPGRERRGRRDAGGAADWSSPDWHRPRRPRKPHLHLKIPHSREPPSAPSAQLVLKLALWLDAMEGTLLSEATTPAPDNSR